MDFRSDNVASVAPEIVAAMAEAARTSAAPYGGDPITAGLEPAFSALFEAPVRVFPVVTGTAANALALAAFTPPYGVVYGARDAHIENDECGAPAFMTGGAKIVGVEERFGKIVPAALEAVLAQAGKGEVHWAQPACLRSPMPAWWACPTPANRPCWPPPPAPGPGSPIIPSPPWSRSWAWSPPTATSSSWPICRA